MPQASQETLDKWTEFAKEQVPGDHQVLQAVAIITLQDRFTDKKGFIRPKEKGYEPRPNERAAIQYLIEEWDYAYEGA